MILASALMTASLAAVPQHPQMHPGMTHEEHMKQMEKDAELKRRGAAAMGFDQNTTQHTFSATADGGSIAVDVKDATDTATRDRIRAHLKEIADAFAKGDFAKPFETHAEVPPGVPVMTQRKEAIHYSYSDTPRGGIVSIRTADPEALAAVHAFIDYQTREHKTT